jgi:ABC-type transport system substrate-binding protein
MTPEVVVTAEANPDYWRPGLPFIDRFEYHTIADPATAFAAFVTDKIDIMGHGSGSPYPPQVEQAMRDFPDKNFVANSYFGARAVGFNTEKPPFDDVRVRQAVNLVMDRQEWHELQRIGDTDMHAGYIGGYFNSQNTDYDPMGHSIEEILTWPGFRQPKDDDIAEANRLLDEVFGAGERPGPFKCLSRADDTSTNACLYMGGTIGKHLGINMTLDLYDSATLSSQLASCNWAFAVTVMPGWEGTPDPYLRYRAYNTDIKGHRPCMGGVDADVQGTLNQNIQDMQTETDFTKRTVLSKAIEYSLFNDYVPAAGMEWQTIYTGYQPWVKGYSALPHHSIHTGHLKIIQRTWIAK